MLVDTTKGEKKPEDRDLYPLISDADRASLRKYSVAEMRARVTTADDRVWSKQPFLSCVLPGSAVELAPVIGAGLSGGSQSAHRRVTNPHGFSVEWLKVPPGQRLPRHAIEQKCVMIVFKGGATLKLNSGADTVSARARRQGHLLRASRRLARDRQ